MHIDPDALAASLNALAPGTGEPPPVEAALAGVIDATRGLFGVAGAGLMLTDAGGGLRYVGGTDAAARALEAAQEELGVGPCVESFVTATPVETSDLARDERWPELSGRVVPAGVVAVLGVPTHIGGVAVGSLNVYRAEAYEWDASDVSAIAALNEVVEGILATAVAAHRQGVVVEQLQTALQKRVTIERAVGVLMERHAVDAPVAFGALRRTARDERRAVADLASQVIAGDDVVGGRLPRPEPT
ncbi:MAG: GAF and ANTAR domain-containing protein [Thermoleophilia bacterium]